MIKRKGQIVPKFICKSIEKKAQHIIKFGTDVEIIGRTIKMLSDGKLIEIPAVKYVLKKKNKKIFKGFIINNIFIVNFKIEG